MVISLLCQCQVSGIEKAYAEDEHRVEPESALPAITVHEKGDDGARAYLQERAYRCPQCQPAAYQGIQFVPSTTENDQGEKDVHDVQKDDTQYECLHVWAYQNAFCHLLIRSFASDWRGLVY